MRYPGIMKQKSYMIGEFFLSVLIISAVFIVAVFGQTELKSEDGIRWSPVYDSNKCYKDMGSNSIWPTSTRNITNSGHIFTPLPKNMKGTFRFAWRSDKGTGFLRHVYLHKNEERYDISQESIDWINESILVNERDKLRLEFWWEIGSGSFWIALPSEQAQSPLRPVLNSSLVEGLWIGDSICLSANATDPEKGDVKYTWDWGDGSGLEHTDFVHSGERVVRNHSWNEARVYTIRVQATNRDNKASEWSDSCRVYVLPKTAPEIPKGCNIAYTGEKCNYSTKIGSSNLKGKVKYIFNWSDGSQDSNAGTFDIGEYVIVDHIWKTTGECKVKAKVLDTNNNPSDWSEIATAIVYNRTYVSDNLQDAINNSSSYTELILTKPNYNVYEIIIYNKDHLVLTSNTSYSNLTGPDAENRIRIDKCKSLKLTRMNLINSKTGIKILDSDWLNISDNQIVFACCGYGISIEGGEYNKILFNTIHDTKDLKVNNCSSGGIMIDNSRNNIFSNNSISGSNNNDNIGFCHYYITNHDNLNNTITPSFNNKEIHIIQGKCVAVWNESGFDYYDDISTEISDNCTINYDADFYPGVWKW
jgi:hypothetical protein